MERSHVVEGKTDFVPLKSEKPSLEELVKGRYENRLRRFSTPERIFEYFASIRLDQQAYMTRHDFVRALVPYGFRKGDELGSKNFVFNPRRSFQKPPKEQIAAYKRLIQQLMILDATACDTSTKTKTATTMEALMTTLTKDYRHVMMDLQTHLEVLRELNISNREFETFLATHGSHCKNNSDNTESFFHAVDADGNGLISYPEYMLFLTLLSRSTSHVSCTRLHLVQPLMKSIIS
jgi:Ca2+-binding EF-hand superfamily protein